MLVVKTWYTLEEAEAKFGVDRATILQWVEDGLVRSEQEGKTVSKVNGDDIDLKVEERFIT